MNDKMQLIPFDKLIDWVFTEYKNENAVFSVPAEKFYKKRDSHTLPFPGSDIENPTGPAAGPHTQLAQNIIAAYLAGGRFFELKTVQILDGEDLPVSKPCILASDEGYNVEWSTELTVPDAMGEYIKAWLMLHMLAKELGLGSEKGFAFNMSVGYDLKGIQSPKIDAFIEGLKDASKMPVWRECMKTLLTRAGEFKNADKAFIESISPNICASVTLSTLHGCPPQEIERIARYLLGEKKLHTYVKCNPTLLGYDFVRKTLDQMGYDYISFDEHHFNNDLQYRDAVPLIRRLQDYATELGLTFGVKLSNTFPVRIENRELPGEEMYMSGRALYPLTVSLAARLAEDFGGNLRISYSGGADASNIAGIYKTGVWPVTFATTLLKPGGYGRIKQLAELTTAGTVPGGIDVKMLKKLAEEAIREACYQKDYRGAESRKIGKHVPLTDCFVAPCMEGCPIGQDIPEYIRLTGEGRFAEALELIAAKNPLPFSTGTICSHPCMLKCTRMDYDEPVAIRDAKLAAAQNGFSGHIKNTGKPQKKSGFKAAVIGAGPAGLSAGYFLAKGGVDVTVFDKKESIGGVLAHVIPEFRLPGESLARDLELVEKSGVSFRPGVDGVSVEGLKKEGYKYILVATGAWKPGRIDFNSDRPVLNVLDFLEEYKQSGGKVPLGKNVAVIGAGNSAMDAARAAKRVPGVKNVTIVYRRTRKYMPADREEFLLASEEGVAFQELLAPLSFQNGVLKCQRMALGAPDASGRRSPVPVEGETEDLAIDAVIAAVGEKADTELFKQNGITVDKKGRPEASPETGETNLENVYIGGDALRGPATIVEAIADGRRFADDVLRKENLPPFGKPQPAFDEEKRVREIAAKKGVLCMGTKGESRGCLECSVLCNACAEVCPNRANVAVKVPDLKNANQIVHLDGPCNACGNCEAFCPYESAPYRDKFTLYWSEADFAASDNAGFLKTGENCFKVRLGDRTVDTVFDGDGQCAELPAEIARLIWTVDSGYDYLYR
jgi:putative selenate reductase